MDLYSAPRSDLPTRAPRAQQYGEIRARDQAVVVELAAIDDFPYRRPHAWRGANAVIANRTHPHANMPQAALDDLRVIDERNIDQRNGAHLVMTLGCHRGKERIDFPNLLDHP